MTTDFNEKQLEILQVAEELFAEKGFDGTSIRDIAKKANINIAMISYYFGSKEKLLESLIVFRTSDLRMQLENLFSEDLTPFQKIDKLIELYIKRLNKNRCLYQILHFEFASKKRVMDFKVFTDVKKQNLISLQKIITEGQEKGVFRKDINTAFLPPTMMGTFFHFHTNRPYYEELFDLKTEEAYDNFIKTDVTNHIKQTIKALLVYEN